MVCRPSKIKSDSFITTVHQFRYQLDGLITIICVTFIFDVNIFIDNIDGILYRIRRYNKIRVLLGRLLLKFQICVIVNIYE